METVGRPWVDFELGFLAGRFQRGFHLFHLRYRNTLILFAVKPENGRGHLWRELHRALGPDRVLRIDKGAVESDARFQGAAMRGINPNSPAAAAETDDPK